MIQTLSTNTVNQGSQVEGLLFVPDLPPNHSCINASDPYIPKNVTRLHDLPPVEYQYVALAPWLSALCTQVYLASVPGKLARAFLFYIPSQNSTDLPPEPNDPTWNLGDGGAWKKANKFPVYAIPGPNGNIIMQQLGQYSGQISDIRNGDRLVQEFNPTDYVRLYATFELNLSNNLPTLWAFLLIVVAVVLLLVGSTSCAMHYVQRRKRRDLRRRVERGEVDLEVLGLKSQQMTQSDIEALPKGPYVPSKDKPDLPLPDPLTAAKISTEAPSPSDYNQPSCPICLEDYAPNETPVRALPCNHIYHPECIEPYLLSTSTLCPVCKANSKPPIPAECPEITNAMVRRERHARRLRDARAGRLSDRRSWTGHGGGGVEGLGRWASFRRHYRPPIRTHVPIVRPLPILHRSTRSMTHADGTGNGVARAESNLPGNGGTEAEAVEMQDQGSRQSNVMREMENMRSTNTRGQPPPQGTEQRREWARQTAGTMLRMLDDGRAVEVEVNRDVEGAERERPRCKIRAFLSLMSLSAPVMVFDYLSIDLSLTFGLGRRGVGRVFPGFR